MHVSIKGSETEEDDKGKPYTVRDVTCIRILRVAYPRVSSQSPMWRAVSSVGPYVVPEMASLTVSPEPRCSAAQRETAIFSS